MNFMKLTAQQSGKTINEPRIYNAMAREYLNSLKRQLASQGFVNRDINHQEAWEFHNKVFSAMGLSSDAWTLNSVFKVMPSESIREAYWKETLAAAGDPSAELLMGLRTQTFMATASVIGSPDVKSIADKWRARIDTPSTIQAGVGGFGGAVQKRIDALFDKISQSAFGVHSSELPVIDLGSLPAPDPTPSPAIAITPKPPVTLPPAPKPPTKPRRPPRGRRRPPRGPTTGRGHPDSGYNGGGFGGGGGGWSHHH